MPAQIRDDADTHNKTDDNGTDHDQRNGIKSCCAVLVEVGVENRTALTAHGRIYRLNLDAHAIPNKYFHEQKGLKRANMPSKQVPRKRSRLMWNACAT